MPLGLLSGIVSRAFRRLGMDKRDPRPKVSRRPVAEQLESRELLSTTWFVSPSGSNKNPGTFAAPFQTIQQAADVAKAGDVVDIETGTYRETVTPVHSGTSGAPITFQAYDNEDVTISGADPVTGWSSYTGSIYEANMTTNLGEGNNEIFVDGVEMNEARFPNTSLDPSDPTTLTVQSASAGLTSAVIYNSSLDQPANYWAGAIIHMDPGQAWVDQTGTVTSSKPGSITISYASPGAAEAQYALPEAGNPFYLVGKFQALDSPGEWYVDPTTGKLYLWDESSNNPANYDVEAKARLWAFNLSGVQDITIQGVNIFAASIETGSGSHNVIINHISASYISQFMSLSDGWWVNPAPAGGIMLMASGDMLENSTIAYASGDGVVVQAPGVTVYNNVIHDVDTIGGDLAGVRVLSPGVTVDHNTIFNCGRDGILANVPDVQILYNTIHDVGLQTTEPGGIYTEETNGQGATIAFNTVYNIHTGGYGGTALFLDNNTSGWSVHNNVTYNVDYALKMNFTCNNNSIYDNTLGANILSIDTNQKGNLDGTTIHNNVFAKPIVLTGGASVYSNVNGTASTSSAGAGNIVSGATGVSSTVSPPAASTPPPTTPSTPPVPSATTLIKAVNYTACLAVKGDNFGGIGYANNDDWISYQLNFGAGVTGFTAGIAAIYGGGSIQIHLGSPTGTLVGTLAVAVTGAWNNYTGQSTAVSGLTGVQTVYLVFKGAATGIANIDWLTFW